MRPITDILRDHRNGRLVEHLTAKLTAVVKAVQATGKKGKIKIELTIAPQKGGEDAFEVIPNVSVTLPEPDLAKALFWPTEDGDLLRSDPSQKPLFEQIERGEGMGDKPNAAGIKPV